MNSKKDRFAVHLGSKSIKIRAIKRSPTGAVLWYTRNNKNSGVRYIIENVLGELLAPIKDERVALDTFKRF
jgi:hypothetical protein